VVELLQCGLLVTVSLIEPLVTEEVEVSWLVVAKVLEPDSTVLARSLVVRVEGVMLKVNKDEAE
jgi:hypothetical protein